MYLLLGRSDCLVLERSFYDVCICADETGLMISESANFGGDGCAGTDTLGTDAVSETTLGDGARVVTATVYFGVNYYGNLGSG